MGRWSWMAHALSTVVTALCSMCLECVRCRAWNPMAAFSTACRQYARVWVDNAAMPVMTRVRVSWRSRLGGRVPPSSVAACSIPRWAASSVGDMGASLGQRSGGGAFCTMVADLTLCTRGRLFSR